jgi:hypothetical protein
MSPVRSPPGAADREPKDARKSFISKRGARATRTRNTHVISVAGYSERVQRFGLQQRVELVERAILRGHAIVGGRPPVRCERDRLESTCLQKRASQAQRLRMSAQELKYRML